MKSICLEVVESSNKFEENNFKNKDLKKMYIKKNIDIINSVMEHTTGYRGSFGTGYPFYAIDSDFKEDLPVIKEQIRYNEELRTTILNAKLKKWPCESCLPVNGPYMEDLKQICIPCPRLEKELKPRKVINRLPDIDMWMVCEDTKVEEAKKELKETFDQLGMHTSDVNPIQTFKEFKEIITDLEDGKMPIKMLPLDVHVVKYSELSNLLDQVPFTILNSSNLGEVPYLPILPDSLRKKWQKDDEAYNFTLDFLYSMTDFNFEEILKQRLDYTRNLVARQLTEEKSMEMLDLVSPDSVKRRFENKTLKKSYKRRINSWKN
jgi:hypothetical protein